MKNTFSDTLFIVQEGPELSGKSSAVARLGKVIQRAIPTLVEEFNIPIHFKKLREPGGSPKGDRGRAFVINFLKLQELAQQQLSDETKAEIFTWARWGLYDDLVPETKDMQGIKLYLGDRSYLSMMALQGKWDDKPDGVALAELEESALWATQGLLPNVALLRTFPAVGAAEEINFRQLMILLNGREIMPQDLAPYTDFLTVQNRFAKLSELYANELNFFEINASEKPLRSTEREIKIVASNLCTKFTQLKYEVVYNVLISNYAKIKREGGFKEATSMLNQQNKVRRILASKKLTANQIMDSYREGDDTQLKEIQQCLMFDPEIHLPRQARK